MKKTATIEASPALPQLAVAISQAGGRDDEVFFWWLGQAGFALKYGHRLLLIDPYLSDSLAEKYRTSELKHLRMTPIPLSPESIRGCGWYLCTHGHTDHMDPLTIRGVLQGSSPLFLVPRAEMERARERGVPIDRIQRMNAGETIELGSGVAVEAVASAHEQLETDAQGNLKYLGYVIAFGDLRLYHSGDCVPYEGLTQQLAEKQIDIALLPINGRDAYRLSKGIPGNFTLSEAIELCNAAHITHLVGHHFELFSFNTIDRGAARTTLRQEAGSLKWVLPEIGMTYRIRMAGGE